MEANTKISIKNLISSRVILVAPELRLKRTWEKKNQIRVVPFEQLEEAMYISGVEALFKDGVLDIIDTKDVKAHDVKVALGLEVEGEEPQIVILDDAQRKRYMSVMPLDDFKEAIKKLPKEQVIELANYAIANEMMDYDKSNIIQKLVDIDIMSAIKLNRDNKEE